MIQSDIDHNAFIISKLIECIIENNDIDFTVSEIEGDAVLFYKIGHPVDWKQMITQCLKIYNEFHHKLEMLEKQATCRCPACAELSKLTLKFVIHYGEIKEVQISNFKKASGTDMIIAHRLLKNSIDNDEYILVSRNFWKYTGNNNNDLGLEWIQSNETYPNVGKIDFEYAIIGGSDWLT